MYASLIGAGVSQLYDLYQSMTSGSGSASATSGASGASFKPPPGPPPGPPPSDDASSSGDRTGAAGAVNSSSSSGGSLSDAVQKLLADLQASASGTGGTAASSDQVGTIGNDLQSVLGNLKAGHGHRPPGPPPSDGTSADAGTSAAARLDQSSTRTNPLDRVASSLLAYSKSQSLTASGSSTSQTA